MASKAATKTVSKVAKVAKSAPKTKAAAPAKKAAEAKTPKTIAIKENAGFKENTARELANKFQDRPVNISSAHEIQAHIFTALRTSLAKQGRVAVPGLGVFKVGSRAARTGRNPKTGEALQIPQTNTVRFSATPAWKKEVSGFKVVAKTPKAKAAK